jgi:hypothetical protein
MRHSMVVCSTMLIAQRRKIIVITEQSGGQTLKSTASPTTQKNTTNSIIEPPQLENVPDTTTVADQMSTVKKPKARTKKATPKNNVSATTTSEIIVIDSLTSNKEQTPTKNIANSSITTAEKSPRAINTKQTPQKTSNKVVTNQTELPTPNKAFFRTQRYAPADQIEKVFNVGKVKHLYTESTYFSLQQNIILGSEECKTKNSAQILTAFAAIKSSFQTQHRIRFAILGGLHRIALAAHTFGNYNLDNKKPTKGAPNMYNFSGRSTLNSVLSVHICIPHNSTLDEIFTGQCREYSFIVQEKKSKSFTSTIKSEIYLLLTSSTKPEVHLKRYIDNTFWTTDQVSHTNLLPIFFHGEILKNRISPLPFSFFLPS